MNTNKKIIIAVVLVAVLLIAIAVIVWAIFFREGERPLPPDYPPQETESNQVPIPDDENGVIQTPEGGGAVNITYAESVTIDLSDKTASLYYANPLRSNQNVAIAIVIGDVTLLKSELITPGNMVTSLPLLEGAYNKLAVGGYNAELIVYCYHPETGEKAIIDAQASVTLNVIE